MGAVNPRCEWAGERAGEGERGPDDAPRAVPPRRAGRPLLRAVVRPPGAQREREIVACDLSHLSLVACRLSLVTCHLLLATCDV